MKKEDLQKIFNAALVKIGAGGDNEIHFEIPKNKEHGDLSTNIAMRLAKKLHKAPREIAQAILENIETDPSQIESLEIAGAGFINIRFTKKKYADALGEILSAGHLFGRSTKGRGKKVNVEYVSVNPTGLLHLGHGRNAAIGDTVANLYEWMGYEVIREYYFNNAGNQMNVLAQSIYARYRQQLDEPDFPFPENGYHGDYVKEIAGKVIEKSGDKHKEGNDKDIATLRKFGEKWAFDKILATLSRMNIEQEVFYNEESLYTEGKIDGVISLFKEKGLAYEKDNALWLALSKMGLEDDRVIVKSTGEPTYRLPDIAYHREKFERGFDILVDVFGADHIATIPDVLAGLEALGYDKSKVRVLIHQFVTLTEGGEQVKMSKRTGKNYTLDDLLDEVGPDVVRFFLIMRAITTHLEFDLELAREQSDKNPVFYLQYAHARICSVFDKAKAEGININAQGDLSLLRHETEINLIKELQRFPDVVETSSDKCEPQILAEFLREVAAAFHIFYHECRIVGAGEGVEAARLNLANATRTVMKNGLSILGITAPERM